MKRRFYWFLLPLLALLSLSSAYSAGLMIVEDTRWWPGPRPPQPVPPPWDPHPRPPAPAPHLFAPLDVTFVKVSTRIRDQLATTVVDQEFENQHNARLEGTFVFPVPKGAQLDKFTLEIDGKPVAAELLPADKARRIYEDIVRSMKDPALLEYAGRDLFKVRVFPIEPRSKRRVQLSYTQLLKSDAGLVSYVLPLSAEKYSARPVKNVSVKVDLDTTRSLKSIYSPTHRMEVTRQSATRATAGYEATESPSGQDLALYFSTENDPIGLNLLTYKPADEDGYFLLLASPGLDADERKVIPKDVAFVLDTSGSMAGKKLEQAKKALLFCVENLNPEDRFDIIRFSTEVEPLFGGMTDATKPNRERAEKFIDGLKPLGGTAINDALERALAAKPPAAADARVFMVVFLTDGRPTIGVTREEDIFANISRRNEARSRVFCFGIGTDVNTHLLDKLAEQARAFTEYVLPEEDLELKVSAFFSKIKEPVLANPSLRFTGDVRARLLHPSTLPDLFKGEQVVVVGRYAGRGDAAIVLEGMVDGKNRPFTYEAHFPDKNLENEFVARLWATRRVGYLLDEIRLRGENPELREEATELARKYGIVTPYTAYLIVEDEARRNVPEQTRSLPALHRDQAVRQEAARSWEQLQRDRFGGTAVSDAQLGQALKSADAIAPAQDAEVRARFMRRYGLAAAPTPAGAATAPPPAAAVNAQRLVDYAQQSQFVAGKNFFQNGAQWIDAALQQAPEAKRIRIQFASAEYFELAAKEPSLQPWLALGRNLQFLHRGAAYEIYE